jgi:2,3-bisphosphoglycerate-dependent phosphoglycerate mutase
VPASQQLWPASIWVVRHGESAGNVARDAAEAAGLAMIDIAGRDMDVPLSSLGERQSRALGAWFREQTSDQEPPVVFVSPYVRAMQTAALIAETAGWNERNLVQLVDERLREKEFGSLNRLTKAGIIQKFPAESELRASIGKFYYRPPGGESWCDVLLRMRSVVDHIQLRNAGGRVLIVAHQVVVLCIRYLLENMNEAQILSIDRERDVANCGVTEYVFSEDVGGRPGMALSRYNFVAPIEVAGEQVTKAPDPPIAPR